MECLFTTTDVHDARIELMNGAHTGRAPSLESSPLTAWKLVQCEHGGHASTTYPDLVPLKQAYQVGRPHRADSFHGFAIRKSYLVFDQDIFDRMDQPSCVALGMHGHDLEIAFDSIALTSCWVLPVRRRHRRYVVRLDPWRHLCAELRPGVYQLEFVKELFARVAIARNALFSSYPNFTNLRASWARPGTTSWDLPKFAYGPQSPIRIPGLS